MDFWGNLNFNFGFNTGNWFLPSFTSFNFFPTFSMPMFNFSPYSLQNIWTGASNTTKKEPQQSTTVSASVSNTSAGFYLPQIPTQIQPQTSFTQIDTFTRTKKIQQSPDNLTLSGYNAKAGEKLANIALNNSIGWTGYCARSVKNAIQDADLGSYQLGHAYQMSSILRGNKNFKEISTENIDVSKLPAGCVLVYGKGEQGYSRDYGHTEITTGDGRAVSDGITRNLHKKPSAVFMPVEQNYYA